MSNTNVQRSSIGYLAGTQFKNLLINPHMEISQRALPVNVTAGNAAYTLDRWRAEAGTGGACSVTREILTLGSSLTDYCLKINQTTGHTGNPTLEQRIESVRTAQGQKVTLSFKAKRGSNPLTIRPRLKQHFGTGGGASIDVDSGDGTDIILTETLTPYSQTFDVPPILGLTLGTSGTDYLAVLIKRMTTSSTYELFITDIQLEVGSVATEIERRPISFEQGMCYRYYEVGASEMCVYHVAAGLSSYTQTVHTKRVTPTLTVLYKTQTSFSTTDYLYPSNPQSISIGRYKDGTTGQGSWATMWAADAEL